MQLMHVLVQSITRKLFAQELQWGECQINLVRVVLVDEGVACVC